MSDTPAPETPPAGPKKFTVGFILALVNTLAVLAALGALIYTRLLFQRPKITEHGEREKIAQQTRAESDSRAQKGHIKIDTFTVNILPHPDKPAADPNSPSQIRGKAHFATLGFSLVIRDISQQGKFESIRAAFMDRLLAILSEKPFHFLASPQGRYVLRTEIVETANKLLKEPLITDVFFTDFIVQ